MKYANVMVLMLSTLVETVSLRITDCERLARGQWKVKQELGGSGTGCIITSYIIYIMHNKVAALLISAPKA